MLVQKPTPKSGLASPSLPESSASLVEFVRRASWRGAARDPAGLPRTLTESQKGSIGNLLVQKPTLKSGLASPSKGLLGDVLVRVSAMGRGAAPPAPSAARFRC